MPLSDIATLKSDKPPVFSTVIISLIFIGVGIFCFLDYFFYTFNHITGICEHKAAACSTDLTIQSRSPQIFLTGIAHVGIAHVGIAHVGIGVWCLALLKSNKWAAYVVWITSVIVLGLYFIGGEFGQGDSYALTMAIASGLYGSIFYFNQEIRKKVIPFRVTILKCMTAILIICTIAFLVYVIPGIFQEMESRPFAENTSAIILIAGTVMFTLISGFGVFWLIREIRKNNL